MQVSYREVLRCLLEGVQGLKTRAVEPKAPGIANGGWSASMAANWTSRTKPRTARPLGFRGCRGERPPRGTRKAARKTVRRIVARKKKPIGIPVRIVEYTLDGIPDAESSYRVATTLLDPTKAPAKELAALCHERWEIESAFDELKTHLRGRQITLRSKIPDLIRQEFYGLMMAHFAIRGLMHEAALKGDVDPDRLSIMHAVRVIRRKMARFASLPSSGQAGLSRTGIAGNPG